MFNHKQKAHKPQDLEGGWTLQIALAVGLSKFFILGELQFHRFEGCLLNDLLTSTT